MYKNASYKEKYADLQEWLPSMVETIKKDIKNEHLKKDVYFIKKYLGSKNLNKVSIEELAQAYHQAIAAEDNGESLAEFITSRWILKNTELYDFFEETLSKINPDFAAIEEIDLNTSQNIVKQAGEKFGTHQVYIFSVLNSVVFPDEIFKQLKNKAHQEIKQQVEEEDQQNEKLSAESLQKNYERTIARLEDKYEKKLSGLQKKYLTDVESLKKQIAQLQRKLHEKSA